MIFLSSPQLINMRKLTQASVLLTCIAKVLGSNFSHINILTEVFCGLPKSFQADVELHHDHFFPSSLNVFS
jgi:hypothetical protein